MVFDIVVGTGHRRPLGTVRSPRNESPRPPGALPLTAGPGLLMIRSRWIIWAEPARTGWQMEVGNMTVRSRPGSLPIRLALASALICVLALGAGGPRPRRRAHRPPHTPIDGMWCSGRAEPIAWRRTPADSPSSLGPVNSRTSLDRASPSPRTGAPRSARGFVGTDHPMHRFHQSLLRDRRTRRGLRVHQRWWFVEPRSDPGRPGRRQDDRFGGSVAVSSDGSTIAVGAPTEDGDAGSQTRRTSIS